VAKIARPRTGDGDGAEPRAVLITRALLRRWPLPQPSEEGDKESRGRVLVVGGTRELPGAVILAGTAALRAGAGKLQIATGRSVAAVVGAAVPEARVFSLTETRSGTIAPSAARLVGRRAADAQAVLVGPGLVGGRSDARLLDALLPEIGKTPLILDAGGLSCFGRRGGIGDRLPPNSVLTPNGSEMSEFLGFDAAEVAADPLGTAKRAAAELRAVITLKGPSTFVVAADCRAFESRAGNVGLATSGSGDVLSGIIAGLAARGAAPEQAACWGAFVHGTAGDRAARTVGGVGFLARDLLEWVARLLATL
jgi:hydroxyethylthiazole kinase-like uncharacterized protein yjeF